MGVFEPVELTWDGATHVIPANRVMGAIESIEEHLTLREIYSAIAANRDVSVVKISKAYAAVLRYAGATVKEGEAIRPITQEDVYLGMFRGIVPALPMVMAALDGLMRMMVPPEAFSKVLADPPPDPKNKKKARKKNPRKAAANS